MALRATQATLYGDLARAEQLAQALIDRSVVLDKVLPTLITNDEERRSA
jgi:hypothetical protein